VKLSYTMKEALRLIRAGKVTTKYGIMRGGPGWATIDALDRRGLIDISGGAWEKERRVSLTEKGKEALDVG
jgi:hypothetical protein